MRDVSKEIEEFVAKQGITPNEERRAQAAIVAAKQAGGLGVSGGASRRRIQALVGFVISRFVEVCPAEEWEDAPEESEQPRQEKEQHRQPTEAEEALANGVDRAARSTAQVMREASRAIGCSPEEVALAQRIMLVAAVAMNTSGLGGDACLRVHRLLAACFESITIGREQLEPEIRAVRAEGGKVG